jgi:hypothetical protein
VLRFVTSFAALAKIGSAGIIIRAFPALPQDQQGADYGCDISIGNLLEGTHPALSLLLGRTGSTKAGLTRAERPFAASHNRDPGGDGTHGEPELAYVVVRSD